MITHIHVHQHTNMCVRFSGSGTYLVKKLFNQTVNQISGGPESVLLSLLLLQSTRRESYLLGGHFVSIIDC